MRAGVNPSLGLGTRPDLYADDAALQSQNYRVRTVIGIELGENAFDVSLCRFFVDLQSSRNQLVGVTCRNQGKYLDFARG